MFKNHEFRIRIAKTNKNTNDIDTLEERLTIDPEKIGEVTEKLMFTGHALTKDLVKSTAKAIGAVVVLSIVASTVGEVIVNKSKQD